LHRHKLDCCDGRYREVFEVEDAHDLQGGAWAWESPIQRAYIRNTYIIRIKYFPKRLSI